MTIAPLDIRFEFETSPTDPPTEPPTGDLRRVKADQFSWSWDYQIRDVVRLGELPSAPAVNRTGLITNPQKMSKSGFTERMQWFSIDLLSMSVHGVVFAELTGDDKDLMVKKWGDFYHSGKMLTNFAGVDNRNNYITGEMRGDDPLIDPLICAGSIVRVLETRTSPGGMTSGLTMARLHAFDELEGFPAVTKWLVDNDPRILTATVIYPDGAIRDFPHYPSQRHAYPFISAHGEERWFPLDDLEKV